MPPPPQVGRYAGGDENQTDERLDGFFEQGVPDQKNRGQDEEERTAQRHRQEEDQQALMPDIDEIPFPEIDEESEPA